MYVCIHVCMHIDMSVCMHFESVHPLGTPEQWTEVVFLDTLLLISKVNLPISPLFFFSFIFISWRLITSQHFSGFCHTLTWISHGVTCIPHPNPPSHLPLHPIPLGLPSAPGPNRRMDKEAVVHIHHGILLSLKKNSFESVLMRWMKLEPIIQSEVSQKDKDQYSILTHIYGI